MLKVLNFIFNQRETKPIENPEELTSLQARAKDSFIAYTATPGGKDFIRYLFLMYCEKSMIEMSEDGKTNLELTFGNIANKELVENLIRYSSIERGDM